MKSYHDELQTADMASQMMKLGSYLFMVIVGLIGFMNLGLQIQGLIFTLGTIGVALVIGLPCGHMLFSYAKRNGIFGMNVYHIPLAPIMVMIVLVGVLQILLSFLLSFKRYRKSKDIICNMW